MGTQQIFMRATRYALFSVMLLCFFLLPNEARAAEKAASVLILPFQINATSEFDSLNEQLPELLSQRIASRGVGVVPLSRSATLLDEGKIRSLDIAAVRGLARKAGADAAIYGSFNQVGDAYSIDARLVYADSGRGSKLLFAENATITNVMAGVESISSNVANSLLNSSTIAHVEVRGAQLLDPDVILLRINTKPGDFIDPVAVDEEIKRIWELGFFSDIQAHLEEDPSGVTLVYVVKEKPRLAKLNVTGNSDVKLDDILSVMGTKPGAILNEKVLASDIAKIQDLYRQKGYYLVKLDYEEIESDAGVSLKITIDEGKRLYIRNIAFEGVNQVREGALKSELALKERGLLSWFTGSGVLKEELIERDVAAISGYYLNLGFMDVAVSHPRIDYGEDGITITYQINEGERYKVGNISFSGDMLDSDVEMSKLVELDNLSRNNGFFNLSVMQDDVAALGRYYAEYGYAYANIQPYPRNSETADVPTLDVVYGIEKNQKVYVRSLILEGNAHTRDNVILREMQLVDGDSFDGELLSRSMSRLNRTGYFELAEAELVPTKNPDEVDLKITVKEAKTGAIMGGVGYSTFSSFGVMATIKEDNLWGKGYALSFTTMFSGRRTSYNINFVNPRLNDTPLSLSLSLYNWKDDYWDYIKRTTGGGARLGYPVGNFSSVYVGYNLDRNHMYDFDDEVSPLLTQYEGIRWGSIGSAGFMRNTTDSLNPTKGTIFKLEGRYAGGMLGGDDDFLEASIEYQIFQQLFKNNVLHFRGRASGLYSNGGDGVPVYQRFWMGGMNSVRGYNSRDIVPRDPVYHDRLGGNRMAFANFEYIWTVSDDMGVALVPFFDAGFNVDTDQKHDYWGDLKRSVGLETRWKSPMGDIRLSYGYPLDDSWDGKSLSGRFEFSMGQYF